MSLIDHFCGYVFIESLAAGTPPLICDRTMWHDHEPRDIGWDLPLDDRDRYLTTLSSCIGMDDRRFSEMSSSETSICVGLASQLFGGQDDAGNFSLRSLPDHTPRPE